MSVKIGFITLGSILIIFSFWNHCFKKLTIDYAIGWSLLGFGLIVINIIPAFSDWLDKIEANLQWDFFLLILLFLIAQMHQSLILSKLNVRMKKLTITLAIVEKENETFKLEIEKLSKERNVDAKENSICH